MKGFIRSYFIAKNFGFIRPEKGKDVFFHRSDIGEEAWKEIGEKFPNGKKINVEFEEEITDKGPRATKMVILGE